MHDSTCPCTEDIDFKRQRTCLPSEINDILLLLKNPAGKRKDVAEDTDFLADKIKRCKINCSPGELRLQRDLQEFVGNENVEISDTESLSKLHLRFSSPNNYTMQISQCPYEFIFTITRYYPHAAPTILCVQSTPGQYACDYILRDGTVRHPSLGDNWSAIGSLATVVDVLESIRQSYDSLRIHAINRENGGANRASFDSNSIRHQWDNYGMLEDAETQDHKDTNTRNGYKSDAHLTATQFTSRTLGLLQSDRASIQENDFHDMRSATMGYNRGFNRHESEYSMSESTGYANVFHIPEHGAGSNTTSVPIIRGSTLVIYDELYEHWPTDNESFDLDYSSVS